MRLFTKSFLVLLAALFSFSMAYAETGTETEADQKNGNKNTTAEGQSYTIDGAYIAGTGSSSASPMTSKGLKFRTGVNDGTLEFTVRENYTITKLYIAAVGNYVADDSTIPYVKVSKVEVDGAEVEFVGGEFPEKGASEAGELTIDNIAAKEKIVLYFDNSNASAGTQLNASWAIDWSRPDATQPTITVTPETVALVPGATYQLNAHVDPNSFTTQWVSSNEAVATVDESGLVTAVAAGTATISHQWADDASVASAAVITVADFNPLAFTLTSYDFTAMGDVALSKGESAGNIWNEANSKANEVFWCTNEGLELLAIQQYFEEAKANTGWKIVDGEGLFLGGGAGRCAAIGGIKAGQIVEFIYTGNHFYTNSTDDGISKTAINEGVGRAIFMANEDGMIGFELDKGNYVTQINIYSSSGMSITAKTIALVPGPWAVDGAIFAAYAWNGEGSAWFPFIEVGGVYATQIPDTFTGMLLARINPEGTDADPWKNVWNQTDDIDFTAVADQTVFTITGWGEGEGAKSTYTTATLVDVAKENLQKVVTVAKMLGIDTTDAEALLANDEATVEQLSAALQTLFGALQQKEADVVAMIKAFFNQFDKEAAAALEPYFAAAEAALAGTDYDAMHEATMALVAKCLEEGKSAMGKVDAYLRKMENETINADLDAIKAAIAGISDPSEILNLVTVIQKLKDDMTPAVMTYLAEVQTLINEGATAGKDVSAVQTAFSNVMTLAISYNAGTATLVEMGTALYELIKAVEAYKNAVEPVVPEFPENAIVYDFKAEQALIAAGTVAKPSNVGGSAANGQAFYGWEKSDKTDSKRQDYKGYAKAEGSQLPDICHVWRRSDRYDQDASWANEGGLTCPNDREYAIDGLNVGDKVIIVYDAENATNKDIIWAIGDGTSEGGPGTVRATATIGGVEAVTGETTIASGAEIVINSVTPAENGSGYIVFQVKKGMVISQIAIVPAEETVSYYLVGTMTNWVDDGVKEDYKLALNTEAGEGIEEYMISLPLTTTDEFKIVKKDGESYVWYPDGMGNNYGQNGEITADGMYTVYFRPNADGGEDWFNKVIYVAAEDTDGISTVAVNTQNSVIYDMQGRRVHNTQKGLYIVNGKKVLIK